MRYFTIPELTRSATAARLGIDNTPDARVIANLTCLVNNVLDPLREAWGRPLHVNSGYRCERLNRAVGGAARSQHLKGEAADITAGTPRLNSQLYDLLKRLNLPVDQAINEKNFIWIHVSHSARNRKQFFAL